jgi:hypothetical protein
MAITRLCEALVALTSIAHVHAFYMPAAATGRASLSLHANQDPQPCRTQQAAPTVASVVFQMEKWENSLNSNIRSKQHSNVRHTVSSGTTIIEVLADFWHIVSTSNVYQY